MRSQLDELLNELEGDLASDSVGYSSSASPAVRSRNTKNTKNELDELLDFMKEDDHLPPPKVSYRPAAQTVPTSKPRLQKCYPLCLGGSNIASGICMTSINPVSCNSMRCTRCDLPVKRFNDAKWDRSVDYLFFRNNYSREDMLKLKLIRQPGSSAYSCQCCWRETSQVAPLKDDQWVCGGHLV